MADSGANCLIFNTKRFFIYMQKLEGTIQAIASVVQPHYLVLVWFRFGPELPIIETRAHHLPSNAHNILPVLRILVHNLTTSPRVYIADRQTAFNTDVFKKFFAARKYYLKLDPRGRHCFNGTVERVIGNIRPMSRAALMSAALDNSFWFHAVAHAIYVKNRTLIKRHFGRDDDPVTMHRFG